MSDEDPKKKEKENESLIIGLSMSNRFLIAYCKFAVMLENN